MAFGQDLIETTIKTRLFRKVSDMNFLKDGEHCFSTSSSHSLISAGTFCLILEEKEYTGKYDEKDADAGKNFGYDEFRVEMLRNELLSNIDYIVVPNSWVDSEMNENDEDYLEENDPFFWIENLSQFGRVIAERNSPVEINFNF